MGFFIGRAQLQSGKAEGAVVSITIAAAALTILFSFAVEVSRVVFLAGSPSHRFGDHEFSAGCMLLAKALKDPMEYRQVELDRRAAKK